MQKLFLHIGRNKAGSTTLQDFFASHGEAMEVRGLRYVLFGHMAGMIPAVPGFEHHNDLAAYAACHPQFSLLASNEFIFGWPPEYTIGLCRDLSHLNLRVLAYIRPYPEWVVSTYADSARNGEISRDFDAYLESYLPRVSAWAFLRVWGEHLGWDKMHIRSTDPRDLLDGNLVGDCLAAMEIDPAIATAAPRRNEKMHWALLELRRSLVTQESETGWTAEARAHADQVSQQVAEHLHECPDAQYLTPAQAEYLARMYNEDIAKIAAHTGVPMQRAEVSGFPERPFLPSWARVPGSVRRIAEGQGNSPGPYPDRAAHATLHQPPDAPA